jgi:signal transduction histidine kinase
VSLVSRLSAFFLAALGAVLVGFSVALYVLADGYLKRQARERLDAALATLSAAAEISPAGVEWEPGERILGLGRDPGADAARWAILDDRGRIVDRSANFDATRPALELPRDLSGRTWQSRTRRVTSSDGLRSAQARLSASPDEEPPSPGYRELTFIAFARRAHVQATLTRLAVTLSLLSVTLWVLAALAGRRLCRRALAPLALMATAARGTSASDPTTRLPLPGTKDELEDLGQAFNGLLDRLHVALERQRRFTGDASHQLRTPLTGLLSQVDVALRQERPAEEYQRVLGVVRTKAAQLRQIIESLLFLARTESDAPRPELVAVDLARWLPDHLQSWSNHPRARDITVLHENENAAPLEVLAHPTLLAQLVDNLIENACKYSRPGTPVVIRLRQGPAGATLAVEDRGSGLTAEEQGRVFQPFYRTLDARTRGQAGVGLGLAVVDRIVAAFGGSIRVASEPGAGSRFEVTLPDASGNGRSARLEAELRAPATPA